ncbi:hypothetical protein ACFWBN_13500 [Streptomyces sp. NPDC059989]|uniref:hypothetical protein n=1 Tax=Streptomyces sp. NPDC059989 TaxID=3347026 RepID=UPI00368C95AB
MTGEGDTFDVHANHFRGPSQLSGTQNNYFTSEGAASPTAGDWIPVTRADPLALGVHHPRRIEGQSALPPYVMRDVDTTVRPRMSGLRQSGGFIVLTGDSTAGKTRCAFESMQSELPDYRVWAPPRHADLRGLTRSSARATSGLVLWLDDLEDYVREDGLDPTLLADLMRQRVVVLATLRDEFVDRFQRQSLALSRAEQNLRFADHLGARLLNMGEQVPLERLWSAAELRRTAEMNDPGLDDALAHHEAYGIPEYLAAGPALLQEMRRAGRAGGQPRGYAFVKAAIDLCRAGLDEVPLAALEELHITYLAAVPGARPESAADAMAWATRIRYGATAMLNPTGITSDSWKPFDYLLDAAYREGSEPPFPRAAWAVARKYARSDVHLFVMGLLAAVYDEYAIAEDIWRPLAEAGHADSCFRLAILRAHNGHRAESELLLSQAADLGHEDAPYGLGLLLRDQGRTQECAVQWQRAAQHGHAEAAYSLSALLHAEGRLAEAELWLRHAADLEQGEALYTLGLLLAKRKQYKEAEFWARRAAERRVEKADELLEATLQIQETLRTVEELREESQAGNTDAAFALGELLLGLDEQKEAETWWYRAARDGHPEAAMRVGLTLGVLRGKYAEGEPWLRLAAAAGKADAMYQLGLNLGMQKRVREADDMMRQAARAGHPGAAEYVQRIQ